MKLSSKIYILLSVISVLGTVMAASISYYYNRAILIDEQFSAYSKLAEFSANRIDQFLYERLVTAEILASKQSITDFLSSGSRGNKSIIRDNLRLVTDIDSHIESIDIIDLGKNIQISLNGNTGEIAVPVSDPIIQDSLLSRVFAGETAYSDVFISGKSGRPAMIFAAPVLDGNKKIIGAVELYLNWSSMTDLLKTIGASFVHLVNKNGMEISSSNPEDYGDILKEDYSQEPFYQDIFVHDEQRPETKSFIAEDLHGRSSVVLTHSHLPGYSAYKGNGWTLVIEESLDAAIGKINDGVIKLGVVVFLLAAVLLLILLIFLKKSIINPINLFASISKRIGLGEKNLRIPETGNDEFGLLAKEFNSMVGKFYAASENLEATVREKTLQLEEKLKIAETQEKDLEKNKNATLNLLEDISNEKMRVENLVLELNKFAMAVESAHEHIIITDIDGVVVYANKAAEQITGYSRDEIVGNKPSLWGRQMPLEFYKQMWKIIKTDKKPFFGQLRNRRKNGVIYDADAQISPIFDQSGNLKFFIGIERDITEQRKLDEARNNFISVASHQLRTPLTAIKWTSELLLSGDIGQIAPEQRGFVEDLQLSANRMIDLVNSLLNIARIESTQLRVRNEAVNLKNFSVSLLKEFEPMIKGRQQSASLTVVDGVPELQTDPRLLYEVLKNLLTNAVKYSRGKGSIRMKIEKSGEEIIISVSDDGIGIPKNDHSKIFTKFFRADNAIQVSTDGTGLGMFIAKGLTELLGGRIWFKSEENKGTIFYIALPMSGAKERSGDKDLATGK